MAVAVAVVVPVAVAAAAVAVILAAAMAVAVVSQLLDELRFACARADKSLQAFVARRKMQLCSPTQFLHM